jgi:hypothetical protein
MKTKAQRDREDRRNDLQLPTHPGNMVQYIAHHQFAFPGSYELLAVLADGALLCSQCLRILYRQVRQDTKNGYGQWTVAGITTEAEIEDCTCDHCNKPIGYQTEGNEE